MAQTGLPPRRAAWHLLEEITGEGRLMSELIGGGALEHLPNEDRARALGAVFLREFVVAVALKARIVDPADLVMGLEPAGERQAVLEGELREITRRSGLDARGARSPARGAGGW